LVLEARRTFAQLLASVTRITSCFTGRNFARHYMR
jgi:hypothetical protein